jgi:hypothetical protein
MDSESKQIESELRMALKLPINSDKSEMKNANCAAAAVHSGGCAETAMKTSSASQQRTKGQQISGKSRQQTQQSQQASGRDSEPFCDTLSSEAVSSPRDLILQSSSSNASGSSIPVSASSSDCSMQQPPEGYPTTASKQRRKRTPKKKKGLLNSADHIDFAGNSVPVEGTVSISKANMTETFNKKHQQKKQLHTISVADCRPIATDSSSIKQSSELKNAKSNEVRPVSSNVLVTSSGTKPGCLSSAVVTSKAQPTVSSDTVRGNNVRSAGSRTAEQREQTQSVPSAVAKPTYSSSDNNTKPVVAKKQQQKSKCQQVTVDSKQSSVVSLCDQLSAVSLGTRANDETDTVKLLVGDSDASTPIQSSSVTTKDQKG